MSKSDKNKKISEALKGNKNAEVWSLEKSTELFNKAIDLTNQKETFFVNGKNVTGYSFDFIGEIAREFNTFKEIFTHLLGRFDDLKELHKVLITNIESNCYYNTKKGIIKEATGIVNLKSNYKWTDRQQNDVTTNGKDVSNAPIINYSGLSEDTLKDIINNSKNNG